MDLPGIPSPEETLADLNWFHPEIYRAFEHGVFKARNHFETENIEPDSSAFSTLVRLHARNYLKKKGFDALEVEHVNLCGLSLKLPKYYIKMWKAVDDGLPAPGHSEPKQEFYQQPLFPNDGENPLPLHLIVIWNVDSQKLLSSLWLICPKNGDEKSAEAHWCVRIPDPTALAAGSPPSQGSPDLPITFKPQAETVAKKA
jgi:hypothetical protein